MKRVLAIALTALLLLGLGACGGGASDDPNVGEWSAVTASMLGIDMEIAELFDSGVSLELKANGKFVLNVDGERGSGKWEYEGSGLKLSADGIDMSATIEGGMLKLVDLLGMGIDLSFEKVGGYNPAPESGAGGAAASDAPPAAAGGKDAVKTGLSSLQEWWNGDWYGYWEVSGATGDYAGLDDERWDCYAVIEMQSDDTGTIYLWDDTDVIFTVSISVSESGGSGAMGAAFSESGYYWDGTEIGHADLIIDPSLYGYDDYLVIDGYFESEVYTGEGFYYWACLRPWGVLWEDIPPDERPPYYEWYTRYETYNEPMLDAVYASIDGGGFIHPELDYSYSYEPSGKGETPVSAEPEATGEPLPAAKLKEAYDALNSQGSAYFDMSYEDIRDGYLDGAEGTVSNTTDDSIVYTWYAEETDTKRFSIVISKESGLCTMFLINNIS